MSLSEQLAAAGGRWRQETGRQSKAAAGTRLVAMWRINIYSRPARALKTTKNKTTCRGLAWPGQQFLVAALAVPNDAD